MRGCLRWQRAVPAEPGLNWCSQYNGVAEPQGQYNFIMADNPQTKKSRSVSLLEVDASLVNKNQLNSSSSKMQYSIGRANRFTNLEAKQADVKFYDIPDTKSKRSTSFGYGNKMEIGKTNFKVPSPGEYSFRSDFDSKKGITISAGREVIRANSAFEIPKPYPGPGQYDPKHMSLGEAEKDKGVALRSRQPDNSQKWLNSVPGPGNYETLELLNKSLKSSNSRITNAKSVRFSKSKRESDFEAGIKNKIPGPGNYEKESNIEATARFPARGGYKFGVCERKGIEDKSKRLVPGPGAYSSFSDFLH